MGVTINKPETVDARTRKQIVYSYYTRGWDWDAMIREAELANLGRDLERVAALERLGAR